MSKWWWVVAVVLVCVVAGTKVSASSSRTVEPTRILFVGDSVTSGIAPGANFPLHFDRAWATVENAGVYGATSTDLNPLEQRGTPPQTPPFLGSYWSLVEGRLAASFPQIVHLMFGVNDAEGVNETCARVESPGPPCPVRIAEYRGNLSVAVEGIHEIYDDADRPRPMILISSPTVAPVSGLGFYGPGNRERLAGYEEQIGRLVRYHENVCFGISGSDVLSMPWYFPFLDHHPTLEGHIELARALEARVEALGLAMWSSASPDQWRRHWNATHLKEDRPAWYAFDVWIELHPDSADPYQDWLEDTKTWYRANKSAGYEQWRTLCDTGAAG